MVDMDFDASQVEPARAFELLPAGWYSAEISASERKAGNSGAYLKLEFTILGPTNIGRKVWTNLNLWIVEDTEGRVQAKQIAQGQMSAICQAVGRMQIRSSEELHRRPLSIKVSVKPAKGEYEAQNDIKGFKALEGQATTMPGAAPASNGPASNKAPWKTG